MAQAAPEIAVVPSPKSGRETITAKDIAARVLNGALIVVGEFRGHKIEEVKWNDRETGKPMMFLKCVVNLEVGPNSEPMAVEVRLPKDLVNPAEVALGLSKGDQVAVRLSVLKREKGITSASVDSPECLLIVKG